MEAEVGEIAGAGKGVIALEGRGTWRNGYRRRDWETRVGKIAILWPTPDRHLYGLPLKPTVFGDGIMAGFLSTLAARIPCAKPHTASRP